MNNPTRAANPFSTRCTRPGALPFLFAAGRDAPSLVAQLAAAGWWGEIVGPHGSGKSTLLAELRPHLCDAERELIEIVLHDGQRRLPVDLRSLPDVSAQTQFVIDGYEQLSGSSRKQLRRFCRSHGSGLLVTAHQSVGLPRLYCTAVDAEVALSVVRRLLLGHRTSISDTEVLDRLDAHQGNLREALFDLYDLYEQRSSASVGA